MTPRRSPPDPRFMDEALALARLSRPSPNPRVGAVVVTPDNVIVGRGRHERVGAPHAEVIALDQAGALAHGADLYVTLEPCSHYGRTPPCSARVAKSGVTRVIIGMVDPDPRVNGSGVKWLEQEGLEVVHGIREAECRALLRGYVCHRTLGRPLVTLKAAITLDGSLATASGDSKWISSALSRARAHALRAESDAVLVGLGTVHADDPLLTVRLSPGTSPLRVVLDSQARLALDSQLVRSASATEPVVVACIAQHQRHAEERFSSSEGLSVLACAANSAGRVDLTDMCHRLGDRGILALLVEGGSHVHGAFLSAGLADRVALFVAPKLVGQGRRWHDLPETATIAESLSLGPLRAETIGDDLFVEADLSKP